MIITVECVCNACNLDGGWTDSDPYVKVELNGIYLGKLKKDNIINIARTDALCST